jgi:hypothetical protein
MKSKRDLLIAIRLPTSAGGSYLDGCLFDHKSDCFSHSYFVGNTKMPINFNNYLFDVNAGF